jgi:hypothetical protein
MEKHTKRSVYYEHSPNTPSATILTRFVIELWSLQTLPSLNHKHCLLK